MPKHTRKNAEDTTRPSSLTAAIRALRADQTRPQDTLEHPLTRAVTVSTDIYAAAILERLSAHCGVSPAQFASEVFQAALNDAADFIGPDLDSVLQDDCANYVDTFTLARFNQQRLDAIVNGWKALYVENRPQPPHP